MNDAVTTNDSQGVHTPTNEEMEDYIKQEYSFQKDMIAMQAELPPIPQTNQSDVFGLYSSLSDILRTVRPVLAKYQFSLQFYVECSRPDEGKRQFVTVTCRLKHISLYTEHCEASCHVLDIKQMNSIQQLQTTVTYLKKMTAAALLALEMVESDADNYASIDEKNQGDQFLKLVDYQDLQSSASHHNLDWKKVDEFFAGHYNAKTGTWYQMVPRQHKTAILAKIRNWDKNKTQKAEAK